MSRNHNKQHREINKIKRKDWLVQEAHGEVLRLTEELKVTTDPEGSGRIFAELQEAHARFRSAQEEPDNCVCAVKTCGSEIHQSEATVIVVSRVIRGDEFLVDDSQAKYIVLCPGCTTELGLIDHFEEYERSRAVGR